MRKSAFWFGWGVLIALPIIYVTHALIIQDLPRIAPWQWFVPLAAVVVIYFSRDTDDVLKHHVV